LPIFRNASRVYAPCRNAFRLPRGAPEPAAPPCIRHRRFPRTAGDWQGRPDLVLARQRGLESIGPVLRWWLPATVSSTLRFCRFCAGGRPPMFPQRFDSSVRNTGTGTRSSLCSMIGMGTAFASPRSGCGGAVFCVAGSCWLCVTLPTIA